MEECVQRKRHKFFLSILDEWEKSEINFRIEEKKNIIEEEEVRKRLKRKWVYNVKNKEYNAIKNKINIKKAE